MSRILLAIFYQHLVTASLSQYSPFETVTKSKTFIDKTELIANFLTYAEKLCAYYISVTCPRKFGKSVNIDMFKRFFELTKSEDDRIANENLFRDPKLNLSIMHYEYIVLQHFGRHPVIHVDFTPPHVVRTRYDILKFMRTGICNSFKNYKWLYESNDTYVDSASKRFYHYICDAHGTPSEYALINGLSILSKNIYQYYESPIILLIDEFGSPLSAALQNGLDCRDITDIVTAMIWKTLMKNTRISYALAAGLHGIVKYNRESLSNIDLHEFLDSHAMTYFCGFTAEDMEQLYASGNIIPEVSRIEKQQIKYYYDGYLSLDATVRIYNPTSVTRYFQRRETDKQYKHTKSALETYWEDPNDIYIIKNCLPKRRIRTILQDIILNHQVRLGDLKALHYNHLNTLQDIPNKCTFADDDFSEINVYFSQLLAMGYISYTAHFAEFYQVPNEEIRSALMVLFLDYFCARFDENKYRAIVQEFRSIAESDDPSDSSRLNNHLRPLLDELFSRVCQVRGTKLTENELQLVLYCLLCAHNRDHYQFVHTEYLDETNETISTLPPTTDPVYIYIVTKNNHFLRVQLEKGLNKVHTATVVDDFLKRLIRIQKPYLVKTLLINVLQNATVNLKFL